MSDQQTEVEDEPTATTTSLPVVVPVSSAANLRARLFPYYRVSFIKIMPNLMIINPFDHCKEMAHRSVPHKWLQIRVEQMLSFLYYVDHF